MIDKLAASISFAGGIVIILLGISILAIRGASSEGSTETLEYILMTLVIVFGISTTYHVSKSGLGKGKPGSKK